MTRSATRLMSMKLSIFDTPEEDPDYDVAKSADT